MFYRWWILSMDSLEKSIYFGKNKVINRYKVKKILSVGDLDFKYFVNFYLKEEHRKKYCFIVANQDMDVKWPRERRFLLS